MKKLFNRPITIVSLLLFLFFLFLPISTAHAADGQLYEVNTGQLNMRIEPSNGATIVGQLLDGSRLTVFEEQQGWVKTFFQGKPVWVAKDYLTVITQEDKEEDQKDMKENESSPNKDSKQNGSLSTPQKDKPSSEKEETADTVIDTPFLPDEPFVRIPKNIEKTMESRKVKISENAITISGNRLAGFEIVLDAGHGGKDAGAVSNRVFEKDLTLQAAQKVADHLKKEGASVMLTRSTDSFISLEERVQKSNASNADAFISIHFDAFPKNNVGGISTHYYHAQRDYKFAKMIHSAVIKNTDRNNRNVRQSDYLVLRDSTIPAVLLELGFMTNQNDLEAIQTASYQDQIAKAIAEGLNQYFQNE
ncbi:N-acetylmuramoyl-L-alanine amidase [Virgibacillus sp. MG-45]|uniref:N-acetylmuramoyl-L-alanine amidase n=1 Tax=Virgibacillus sp. MG-45 TaxID=3102791 RepID=UPI002EDB5D19